MSESTSFTSEILKEVKKGSQLTGTLRQFAEATIIRLYIDVYTPVAEGNNEYPGFVQVIN